MIPVKIDVEAILADLSAMGWPEYRVEKACGLPRGWLCKLRQGKTADPGYSKAARLHNFWSDRCEGKDYVPVVQIVSRRYVDGKLAQWIDVLRIGDANKTT